MSASRNASARTIHAATDALSALGHEIDPEQVALIGREALATRKDQVVAAVIAWLDAEASKTETPADEPKAKKPRKASLTLSQRRALLKLQQSPQTPASAFKELPYVYLVEVGLASPSDDGYVLTATGRERAASINPGYVVWASGESVCGDPTRPPAGTKLGIHDLDPTVTTPAARDYAGSRG